MTIEINDAECADAKHALRCAIAYTIDRLRSGLETAHPDRFDSGCYRRFEDHISVAKSLRGLLEKLEPSERKDKAE